MSDQEERDLLTSAERALAAARVLFHNGFTRDAVNRRISRPRVKRTIEKTATIEKGLDDF